MSRPWSGSGIAGADGCRRDKTGGWHQWLWQLRLAQTRAELALARDAVEEAITAATEAIDASRARQRPNTRRSDSVTRARGLHAAGRTHAAIADARQAVETANAIADPALLLMALDALLDSTAPMNCGSARA